MNQQPRDEPTVSRSGPKFLVELYYSSYSLTSLKGDYIRLRVMVKGLVSKLLKGGSMGDYIGCIRVDTRNLDDSLYDTSTLNPKPD